MTYIKPFFAVRNNENKSWRQLIANNPTTTTNNNSLVFNQFSYEIQSKKKLTLSLRVVVVFFLFIIPPLVFNLEWVFYFPIFFGLITLRVFKRGEEGDINRESILNSSPPPIEAKLIKYGIRWWWLKKFKVCPSKHKQTNKQKFLFDIHCYLKWNFRFRNRYLRSAFEPQSN